MMEYPRYEKVLFCTDFSENADYAFEFAYGVAKRDGGVLYILHVIPDGPQQQFVKGLIPRDLLEETQGSIRQDVNNKLEELDVARINNGIRLKIVTKSGSEDRQIIKFAKDEDIDLIVMGTHGKTGISHALFGSVAEKVIQHSHIPVLVIPCREKGESE